MVVLLACFAILILKLLPYGFYLIAGFILDKLLLNFRYNPYDSWGFGVSLSNFATERCCINTH